MVWRWLLHSYVQQAVMQHVQNAAAGQVGAAAETTVNPQVSIGLIFALDLEAGGIVDQLQEPTQLQGPTFTLRQGRLAGHSVAVMCCGVGAEAARTGTAALITGHRPTWVISAGFAGGLQPQLKRHDVLMVNEVVTPDGRQFQLDLQLSESELAQQKHLHSGRLLTLDHLVRTTAEKRTLGDQHQACAVDMETAAVAEVCRELQVPLLAVRIISDGLDDELPPEVTRLLEQRPGARQWGYALGTVIRRPSRIMDLWTLREQALLASERLAKFLVGLIGQLPPAEPGTAATGRPTEGASP